jgi:phosphate transport system permease protein
MALLTLPVVIVSVEEAIKNVPKELREASLALGATKWETILRIVLPNSITGILTGGILAVSRGAGEVAPILFTGAAYFLPHLPTKLSDQFMELGYHVYIMSTQSTNVEETKGLQYATTLVLLLLTFCLNFSAVYLRYWMRKRTVT